MEHSNTPVIAEAETNLLIRDAQEALELLVNYKYQGIDYIIVRANNLHTDFFDLKTGLAGEILQKFSNYDGYLGILVDHAGYESKSLNDFILESNKTRRIVFAPEKEQLLALWWPNLKK